MEGVISFMGLNISLYDRVKRQYERAWDSLRQGDDRNFVDLITTDELKAITEVDSEYNYPDRDIYHRPDNFDNWRKMVTEKKLEPIERYYQLLELLEKNENLWIEVIY